MVQRTCEEMAANLENTPAEAAAQVQGRLAVSAVTRLTQQHAALGVKAVHSDSEGAKL